MAGTPLATTGIPSATTLAQKVFLQFEAPGYSQEGIHEFQSFLQTNEQLKKLRFYGAFDQQKLIGTLAMRDSHISLLFVEEAYHRKGVAKSLFHDMQSIELHSKITVNSSPYAVVAYQHPGFNALEEEQLLNGIRFTR